MRGARSIPPAVVLGALLVVGLDCSAGGSASPIAQSGAADSGRGVVEGIGGGTQPNPQSCARCYEKLESDNRDCEALEGQDWKICREAAATAYRRCSEEC